MVSTRLVHTRLCPRCRIRYIVNDATELFHKSCVITDWKAKW